MRNILLEGMQRRQRARRVDVMQRLGLWVLIAASVITGAWEVISVGFQ